MNHKKAKVKLGLLIITIFLLGGLWAGVKVAQSQGDPTLSQTTWPVSPVPGRPVKGGNDLKLDRITGTITHTNNSDFDGTLGNGMEVRDGRLQFERASVYFGDNRLVARTGTTISDDISIDGVSVSTGTHPADAPYLVATYRIGGAYLKAAYSSDGGYSWEYNNAVADNVSSGNAGNVVAFDKDNIFTVYYSRDVQLAYSNNGGKTWATKNNSIYLPASDRPLLYVNPSNINDMVACFRDNNKYYAARSTDGGDNWGGAFVAAEPKIGSTAQKIQADRPSIGGNGRNVYLIYRTTKSGFNDTVWVSRSSDMGSSWSTPQKVAGDGTSIGTKGMDISDNGLYATFYNASNDYLGLGTYNGSTWSSSYIDTSTKQNVGMYSSIYAPDANNIFIRYTRVDGPDKLKAKNKVNGSWQNAVEVTADGYGQYSRTYGADKERIFTIHRIETGGSLFLYRYYKPYSSNSADYGVQPVSYYTSNPISTGGVAIDNITFTWTERKPGGTSVYLQAWNGSRWVNVTSGTKYTTGFDGLKSISYRVVMSSNNTIVSPTLEDVTIKYDGYPDAPEEYISDWFNTNENLNKLYKLSFNQTLPSYTNLEVQLQTSSDGGTTNSGWYGPAGIGSWYSGAGIHFETTDIPNELSDGSADQWVRYKVRLTPPNRLGYSNTPVLSEITILCDVTGPSANIDHPLDTYVNSAQPLFSAAAQDSTSGVADLTFQYKLSSEPESAYLTLNTDASSPYEAVWDGKYLLTGEEYDFRIIATDNVGNQSFDQATVTCDTTPPPAITDLDTPSATNTDVKLTWTEVVDPSSGVAHYNVYRSQDVSLLGTKISLDGEVTDQAVGTEVSYTDPKSGLSNGTVYYYTVRAIDKAGNEQVDGNNQVEVKFDTTLPSAVTDLTAPSPTHTDIELSWTGATDSFSGIGYYRVYRSEASGSLGSKISTDKDVTQASYTDPASGLSEGTAYYYTVKAVDKAGNERTDGNNQIEVKFETTPPPPVADLQAPSAVNTDVGLTWTEVVDASSGIDYYNVYRSEASGSLGSKISTDRAVTQGSYTDPASGLSDGVTYYYTVRAVDKAGNEQTQGNNQAAVKFDLSPPLAVGDLSVPSAINKDVELTWTAVTDPVSGFDYYRVYRSEASGSLGSKISTDRAVTQGSYTDPASGLSDGVTYYYTVRAVDKAGNEQTQGNNQAAVEFDISAPVNYAIEITQSYVNTEFPLTFQFFRAERGATYDYSVVDSKGSAMNGKKRGPITSETEAVELESFSNLADGILTLTVSLTDPAGNKGQDVIASVAKDTTVPAGGGISYFGTEKVSTSDRIRINLTKGNDGAQGTGIVSRTLERSTVSYTSDTLGGAFDNFSFLADINALSPGGEINYTYKDTPAEGEAYKYRYVEEDGAGNKTIYALGTVVKAIGPTHHYSINDLSSIVAGTTGAYTVSRRDGRNNEVIFGEEKVYLLTSSKTGVFKDIQGGVTFSRLLSNGMSRADFWYYDEKAAQGVVIVVSEDMQAYLNRGIIDAQDTLDVNHAAPHHFTISAGTDTMNAGVPAEITLTAYDSFDNVATGYDGEKIITFDGAATSDSGKKPTCTNTVGGNAVDFKQSTYLIFHQGVASTSMTLYKAGIAGVFAVSDDGVVTLDEDYLSMTVLGGAAVKLSWGKQYDPGSIVVANAPWKELTVHVTDEYGNTSPQEVGIVLEPQGTNVHLSQGSLNQATAKSGVAVFSNFAVYASPTYPVQVKLVAKGEPGSNLTDSPESVPVTLKEKYTITFQAKDSISSERLPQMELTVYSTNSYYQGGIAYQMQEEDGIFGNSRDDLLELIYDPDGYSFEFIKEDYVKTAVTKIPSSVEDSIDGYDATINWTQYLTSMSEALADYKVLSSFVYTEPSYDDSGNLKSGTDQLNIRLWLERRGKLIVNQDNNKLQGASVEVYDEEADKWITVDFTNLPDDSAQPEDARNGTYQKTIPHITTSGPGKILSLKGGRTYFAKCKVTWGSPSNPEGRRVYVAGTTFTVSFSEELKNITEGLKEVTGAIAAQTGEIKTAIKEEMQGQIEGISERVKEIVEPKIGEVKKETSKILTAVEDNLPQKISEVKEEIVSEVTPHIKSAILNRETTVKLGDTITVQYRTDSGLSPTLDLYSPGQVLLISGAAMSEVGTSGVYEAEVKFLSSWGAGDFSVVCSEPVNGTMDALTLTAVRTDLEDMSGQVAALLGKSSELGDLKDIIDTLNTQFGLLERALTQITENLTAKAAKAKAAAGSLEIVYTQLSNIGKQIEKLGATKGVNLEKLYEMSKEGKENIVYLKNKTQELKAAMDISRKMIETTANKPLVQTWFEFR